MSLKTFSIILILLILNSCEKEKSTIFFEETSISASDTNFVSINIPKAVGHSKEVVKNINTTLLDSVYSHLNIGKDRNKDLSTIQDNIDLFNNSYKKFKSDFPESQQVWEALIDGEVLYQSNEIISLSITSYINTGGAHGNLHITLLNFNTSTGRLLTIEDIFDNLNVFQTIAKPYFYKAVKDKGINDINSFALPENIGFNEHGAILLYNIYEIAPYSTGLIEFTIPFSEIAPILVFNSF